MGQNDEGASVEQAAGARNEKRSKSQLGAAAAKDKPLVLETKR